MTPTRFSWHALRQALQIGALGAAALSADAQTTSAPAPTRSALPPLQQAQPLRPATAVLRFGTPGAARYEDFAALPDATVIEGPAGKRTTAGEVKRARQATLAHRAAATRVRPLVAVAPSAGPASNAAVGLHTVTASSAANLAATPLGIEQYYGCGTPQVPQLSLNTSAGCNDVVLKGSGFGTHPEVSLVGSFPGGRLALAVLVESGGDLRVKLPGFVPSGVPQQCAAGVQGLAPTPNARLVVNNKLGQETSMEICVVPETVRTPVTLSLSRLRVAATQPPAEVTTQGNTFIVRRHIELQQPYAAEWQGGTAPHLNCFAPGQDTIDIPALPAGANTQFRWDGSFAYGISDLSSTTAADGSPGYQKFSGGYQFAFDGSQPTTPVKWGVWESFHDAPANSPEGDSKVCLSLYSVTLYLRGPKGMAAPPMP